MAASEPAAREHEQEEDVEAGAADSKENREQQTNGSDIGVDAAGGKRQRYLSSLNSTAYTNRVSLSLFLLHLLCAIAAVSFLVFKAVEGVLQRGQAGRELEIRLFQFWLPQIEGSAAFAILLAFAWQKAVRLWPAFMVRFILWSTCLLSLAAGVTLLCFSMAATDVIGVFLLLFAVGNGLYSLWVNRRVGFTARVVANSVLPVPKFPNLNLPIYWMMGVGFVWISLWSMAVIGALNFYAPPLVVIALVASLAWTAAAARNVANLTTSRVIALYYLRGMQSDSNICFQRAITSNLGTAALASVFFPTVDALRILARLLKLMEGASELRCLRFMESIFRSGNRWALVHVAAYGAGLLRASESTSALLERRGMEAVVESDVTTALWFLTGVASGSACVILAGAWTFAEYKAHTATVSLLAFFIGYLLTRIGMALPQACVGCYYVCYAESPGKRVFDSTIADRMQFINEVGDVVASTRYFPWRIAV